MNWCWLFHKWLPWKDESWVEEKRSDYYTARLLTRVRYCERCNAMEFEVVEY